MNKSSEQKNFKNAAKPQKDKDGSSSHHSVIKQNKITLKPPGRWARTREWCKVNMNRWLQALLLQLNLQSTQ